MAAFLVCGVNLKNGVYIKMDKNLMALINERRLLSGFSGIYQSGIGIHQDRWESCISGKYIVWNYVNANDIPVDDRRIAAHICIYGVTNQVIQINGEIALDATCIDHPAFINYIENCYNLHTGGLQFKH